MSDGLLTAREAASPLSVPHTWVLAEARGNRIPHVRIGRYVRFRRESLLAWVAARERGPIRRGRGKIASEEPPAQALPIANGDGASDQAA
jgi:excisionase family DNA binding protein